MCHTQSMSKRLQVLIPDAEMDDINRAALMESVSVGQWVRKSLRESCFRRSGKSVEAKLAAIRQAAEYSFPTGDMDEMLADIERGRFA